MSSLTSYSFRDGVASIVLDDGKVNALSPAMLSSIAGELDRAEADGAIVVLSGRDGTFSAGFDLRTPGDEWPAMVADGARLAERLLSFPHPVVAACGGSAVAMGGFMLLSSDYRVGVTGGHRIGLNEVAIGLTLPWFGVEIARHRLTRPYFDRCTVTGGLIGPEEAVRAGFLDRLVAPEELRAAALEAAQALAQVDRTAHAATKLRVRAEVLAGVRDGIDRIEGSDGREW
jgi:enoyl-CoA hydratase